MDLTTMRATFKKHTSGLTSAMTDGEIDILLNDIYTGFLPIDVDGKIHEVIWSTALVVNQPTVAIPINIYSFPTGHFWIQGTGGAQTGTLYPLSYYEHITEFQASFPNRLDPLYTGRPEAVFREGRTLHLSVYPDANYTLVAEARGVSAAALTSDGLPYTHAMSVITAAAWNFLLDEEDEVGAQREATRYETWKARLQRESNGNYHDRVPNRSF